MRPSSRDPSAGAVNGPGFRSGPRRAVIAVLTTAVLAAVLTASGAFDTDDLTTLHRLALWLLIAGLAAGQPLAAFALLRRQAPDGAWGVGASAVTAVLVAIVLLTLQLHGLKHTPLLPKAPDPWLPFFAFVAPPAAAIAAFVLGLDVVLSTQHKAGIRPCDPDAGVEPRVLWIRAHDHYLEIVTEHGRRFRRDRLADWVERLSGVRGAQVHRSWWVADAAVVAARRHGRDYKLELRGGVRAPLARSRVRAAQALGWLDRVGAGPDL